MRIGKTFGRTMLACAVVLGSAAALAAFAAPGPQSSAETRPQEGGVPEYAVDGTHSTVIFKINHLGVSYFYGRFNEPGGSFRFDPDQPSASSFTIELKADNVDTGNERRDGHLKSPDFFNAAEFPKISFESTDVTKRGKTFEVTGDLTMHGVTKSIKVPLEHVGTSEGRRGTRTGFNTTFTVSRSDFGINYMPDGLGDEVTLMIGMEGVER